MVQKPLRVSTQWSPLGQHQGTPAWHRLFLRSHKKKKTTWSCWLLRDLWLGVFVFRACLWKTEKKWWKKRYTPFLHSPKNNLGCIVCSLRCLDSMFYVFGVQSSRTSVSVIWMYQKQQDIPPPKHAVPPRNKDVIRPTIMGNTHS